MKLHILSDLHLEFGSFTPPETDADVVILAGDIHMGPHGVAWAKEHFSCPVIYVSGNHEFYGGNLASTAEAIKAQAKHSNVHVLDNDSLELGGVRFLGTTLWTDYRMTGNQPLAEINAQRIIKDFSCIANRLGNQLLPSDLAAEHSVARTFLERELGRGFEGKTVVVTHQAPSALSIHPRYLDHRSHLNASYASNLDPLIGGDQMSLWIHGHVHDSMDYDQYGTRVVCNPRGYFARKVNPTFNPALIIEV